MLTEPRQAQHAPDRRGVPEVALGPDMVSRRTQGIAADMSALEGRQLLNRDHRGELVVEYTDDVVADLEPPTVEGAALSLSRQGVIGGLAGLRVGDGGQGVPDVRLQAASSYGALAACLDVVFCWHHDAIFLENAARRLPGLVACVS